MMAEAKTAVFLRGEDGKPYAAATFDDFDDAQRYYNGKRRAGQDAYIGTTDTSAKVLKRHFPAPEPYRAANSAFAARMANARAQVLDEQIGEAARAEVAKTTSSGVKEMKAAAREDQKANEEAAKAGESTSGESTPSAAGSGTSSTSGSSSSGSQS
jgi:hypothetical protein